MKYVLFINMKKYTQCMNDKCVIIYAFNTHIYMSNFMSNFINNFYTILKILFPEKIFKHATFKDDISIAKRA